MSYQDEERLNAKRAFEQMTEEEREKAEKQEEKTPSIYDEYIMLNEKKISFQRMPLADLGLSMYMPADFTLMPDEIKEMAYVRTRPPKYAYYGEDVSFCIAINITESPLKKAEVKPFLNMSHRIIETMVPQARVLRTYMNDDKEFPVGNAEFLSGSFDGKLYNLMLFASVGEKLVVINTGFVNQDKKSLLPIVQEMAASLQMEEGKDESNHI